MIILSYFPFMILCGSIGWAPVGPEYEMTEELVRVEFCNVVVGFEEFTPDDDATGEGGLKGGAGLLDASPRVKLMTQ